MTMKMTKPMTKKRRNAYKLVGQKRGAFHRGCWKAFDIILEDFEDALEASSLVFERED